jgi:hypothetical protein
MVKAAVSEAKDYYRSELSHFLSQSKLYSEQNLQNYHLSVQQKAVEQLNEVLCKGPPDVLSLKEKEFKEVGSSLNCVFS